MRALKGDALSGICFAFGRLTSLRDGTTLMASKPKKPEADDSDEPEEGAEAQAKTSKLKALLSLKMMIIAGAALAVLGGGGAGAYFFLLAGKKDTVEQAEQAKPAVFVDLPDVLV